jgi:glycosyltransferase involved in cell wall biosynthesis
VGAVREIVAEGVGEVVGERDAQAFAGAIDRTLARHLDRASVRAHAERFSWDPIVRRYFEILAQAARQDTGVRGAAENQVGY